MSAPTDLPLDEMEAAAKAAARVDPGEWRADRFETEGGNGRYFAYAIYDDADRELLDTMNSHHMVGEIHDDRDGDGGSVWDEAARIRTEHIAAFSPQRALALVAELRDLRERLKTETQRADDARALVDRLILQAQIWAGEARCANATIHESYQAVTGATGEPGNWNGARPIIEAVQALRERIRVLEAERDFLCERIDGFVATDDGLVDEAERQTERAEAAEQRAREMEATGLERAASLAEGRAIDNATTHDAAQSAKQRDIYEARASALQSFAADLRRAAQALKEDAS